ncbi:hypothetical protein C8R47DRAFT_1322424 [Mycena vitilis]|nr:hypothetical protein C8R47DRAFT_1322424 [Mycena vitilis]
MTMTSTSTSTQLANPRLESTSSLGIRVPKAPPDPYSHTTMSASHSRPSDPPVLNSSRLSSRAARRRASSSASPIFRQAAARRSMHRTLSVDYAVVLSGEIVLVLDGGEEKTVKAGEFMVQRGANHVWHNRTQAPCRIAVVMVGTEKIVVGGKALEVTVSIREEAGVDGVLGYRTNVASNY